MLYSKKQIIEACQRVGIDTWIDDLLYQLDHGKEITYDDSRVYFVEERARDQRLDCINARR